MIFTVTKKIRMLMAAVIALLVLAFAYHSIQWVIKVIYPFHYRSLILKYADIHNVDPLLVAAVIRNESKFNPNAISRKDAKGLMQIAPITGKWASSKLNIADYTEDMLYEPELNINIGCWYLNVLNNKFDYNLELVIAAYNAGNGNVTRWLQNPEYSRDGKTLDKIPFEETRLYLMKVLRDYRIYKKIYGNKI